jgi:hypothetical protein
MVNPTTPPVPTSILGLTTVPQTPTGGEFIPIVQNGVTYKAALSQVGNTGPQGPPGPPGAVGVTGSPVSGNLAKFSSALGITNADLTGDVTTSGGVATTITAGAVTGSKIASNTVANSNLANMAAITIKGNNTGSPAAPSDLTQTQATALINAFTTTLSGAVPAPGTATGNNTLYDTGWAAKPATSWPLGSWATRTGNTVYQESTDGFVVGTPPTNNGGYSILTDGSNPPTTNRETMGSNGSFIGSSYCCPVRKGDYWKATGGGWSILYWIPIGS